MSPHSSSSSPSTSRAATSSAINVASSSSTSSSKPKRTVTDGSSANGITASRSQFPSSRVDWSETDHHPFRLEVQDVTPVSVSFLWSLRPPPISQYRPLRSKGDSVATDSPSTAESKSQAPRDEDDWPSDDGATAVDDDTSEKDNLSETSETPAQCDQDTSHTPQHVTRLQPNANHTLSRAGATFEAGVTVSVNGQIWTHVVLYDQGADEAVVIVYGLLPGKKYEMDLSVGSQDRNGAPAQASATFSAKMTTAQRLDATSGRESAELATPEREEANAQSASKGLSSRTTSLPPSENGHPSSDTSETSSALRHQSEVAQAEARRDSLAATLRQSRKDASRAEQSIRNEIEAIRKALERLSSNDHRAKQKVLALQESIRQANQQAADYAEEAQVIEKEQTDWDAKAQVAGEEEARERKIVEDQEANDKAIVDSDRQLTAESEKSRAAVRKQLDSKRTEAEKLRTGRLAELEAEISKLQTETDRIRNSSTPPPQSLHPSASANWQRTGGLEPNAPPFQPASTGYRSFSGPPGAPRGQFRDRGGRGGKGGPHPRNIPTQFHRRGRGALASGGSAGSHAHFVQHGPALSGGGSSSNGHGGLATSNLGSGPDAVNTSTSSYGAHGPQHMSPYAQPHQGLPTGEAYHIPSPLMSASSAPFAPSEPTHQPSHPLLPTLNTSMADYTSPTSANASPVISKSRNISPIPPFGPQTSTASGGSGMTSTAWNLPSATAPDFSPQFPHHEAAVPAQSRYAFTRTLPKVSTASNSPTLHHHASNGSLFGLPGANGRHDSPTSSFFGHGSSRLAAPDTLGRRGSYGPLDYTDDDAFDPTAGPLPSKTFLGGSGNGEMSGSNRPLFNSSPWSSHRPASNGFGSHDFNSSNQLPPTSAFGISTGINATSTGSTSPWAHSSPLLDSLHTSGGASSAPPAPTDAEVWSPNSASRLLRSGGPGVGNPTSAPYSLNTHRGHSPSLLGGGAPASVLGHFAPHRNNSGSSGSNHSSASAGASGIAPSGPANPFMAAYNRTNSSSLPTSPTGSAGAASVAPIGHRSSGGVPTTAGNAGHTSAGAAGAAFGPIGGEKYPEGHHHPAQEEYGNIHNNAATKPS